MDSVVGFFRSFVKVLHFWNRLMLIVMVCHFLMHCWIWLNNIILWIFQSYAMDLCSLSGFVIKVVLNLQNQLGDFRFSPLWGNKPFMSQRGFP